MTSVVASEYEFIIRLPDGNEAVRLRLQRLYQHDRIVKLGPQFVRINRLLIGKDWVSHIISVLESMQSPASKRNSVT